MNTHQFLKRENGVLRETNFNIPIEMSLQIVVIINIVSLFKKHNSYIMCLLQ